MLRTIRVVCLLFMVGSPAHAESVAEWVAAYQHPKLTGPGVDAAGRTLTFGHLTLELDRGRLYPVEVGDRIAGHYFIGHGRFRYVSTERFEAVNYPHNVKEVSDYEVDAKGGFGDVVE